jgi:hypothetical protein
MNSWNYTVSSDWRLMNWKGFGRKWSLKNLRHYPSICLEGFRKATKNLGTDSPCLTETSHLPNAKSLVSWLMTIYLVSLLWWASSWTTISIMIIIIILITNKWMNTNIQFPFLSSKSRMREITYRYILKWNIVKGITAKRQLMFMWYTVLDIKRGTSITSHPVNMSHIRMIQNRGRNVVFFLLLKYHYHIKKKRTICTITVNITHIHNDIEMLKKKKQPWWQSTCGHVPHTLYFINLQLSLVNAAGISFLETLGLKSLNQFCSN